MLIVAIRTLIMYLVLLLAVRIMGKSELSKMSPFQLVIVFMIAELAAIPIDSADVFSYKRYNRHNHAHVPAGVDLFSFHKE